MPSTVNKSDVSPAYWLPGSPGEWWRHLGLDSCVALLIYASAWGLLVVSG